MNYFANLMMIFQSCLIGWIYWSSCFPVNDRVADNVLNRVVDRICCVVGVVILGAVVVLYYLAYGWIQMDILVLWNIYHMCSMNDILLLHCHVHVVHRDVVGYVSAIDS